MTNTKSTKRALLTSVMALFLCFAMLLGTTYAWFTDSVTSGVNQIIAGKLDVDVYYGDPAAKNSIQDVDTLFKGVTLWEPGAVAYETLTVKNLGSLALKYQMAVNFTNENEIVGTGAKLSQVLRIAVVDPAKLTDRETALAAAQLAENAGTLYDFDLLGDLTAGESDQYGIVIWWAPSAEDNNWNVQNDKTTTDGEPLHIDLGIRLLATQLNDENDGFKNPDYDEDAWMDGWKVYSAQDLQAAINNGVTNIELADDIDLAEPIVIPAAVASTMSLRATPIATVINLNGKTINNANGYAIENRGNLVIMGEGMISGLGAINSVGGTLEINGGTYTGSSDYASSQWQHVLRVTDSVATINGGTFDASIGNLTNAMINVSDNGTLVINGGVFNGTINKHNNAPTYLFTYKSGGSLTINDGTFTGGWRFNDSATTNIYGGTFDVSHDGQSFQVENEHKLTVYGGTFANKLATSITTCLASGYQAVDMFNGTYTVYEGDSLVAVEGNSNLNTVIANAKDGDIILINEGEYTVTQLTVDNKSLTIVGIGDVTINGKQSNEHVFQLRNGAAGTAKEGMTVTIKNVTLSGLGKCGIIVRNDLDLVVEDVTFAGTYTWGDIQVENSYDTESTINKGIVTVNATNVVANKVTMAADDGRTTYFYYENCDFGMIENQNLGGTVYIKDEKVVTPSKIYFAENATKLQSILDTASGNTVIKLLADITGDVIVNQKEGVNITIDGAGYDYDGVISIYGHARHTGAETLTIKNIDFVTTSDVDRYFIDSNWTDEVRRYAHNVTIDNCTFTNNGDGTVVPARFRQAYNITIKNCKVYDTFSPLWTTGVHGLTIDNVTATCTTEGITIGASDDVLIKNCTITVPGAAGFGIRTDAYANYVLTVNNCTLNATTPIVIRGSADTYKVIVDGANYVSTTAELINAIKNAPVGETTTIVMADGTYAGDIDITLAAMGKQGGDVVIKAMDGATPVITGTVTLGYRQQNVGAAMYNANIDFVGITFDHAESEKNSLEIGDVKSIDLINCKIIGAGETGIHAANGNATGPSKIIGCIFTNAAVQGYGNYCTDMLIDGSIFNNSCINIQGGNGVTVQNCTFSNTLTDANKGESFYVIRTNSTPITVTKCKVNVNSTVTGVGVPGSKGWGVFVNRGTTNWTVTDVEITMTDVAMEQTALTVATCLLTGKINMTNVTLNGDAVQ